MKLRNAFTTETRELFRDVWECSLCKENGSRSGGLELHHITGRKSNSPLNASIVCKNCHSKIKHTFTEESKLLKGTIVYLIGINYKFTEQDIEFYKKLKREYNA